MGESNKEEGSSITSSIFMNLLLAILGIITILAPVVIPVGLVVITIWLARYFFSFSLFEASVISIGIWGMVILMAIYHRLDLLYKSIVGRSGFYDDVDYEEEEEEEDEEEQDKRIQAIFDRKEMDVTRENLERYLTYLKENIEFPCQLTGAEAFEWEEFYLFGPGNKKEYERLKKTRPSSKDWFNLISFHNELNEDEGILVNVQRVRDKKKFTLPLADLEATNEESKNYQLIEDYAAWFVNHE